MQPLPRPPRRYLRAPPNRRATRSPSPQPASKNLRKYLENARLPSISRNDSSHPYYLPRKGRRSHRNRLRVKKDPERHIDHIRQLETKTFNEATKTYHKYFMYGDDGPPFAGKHYKNRPDEALVLKSPMCIPEGDFDNTPYPSSVEETCMWLAERPFKTMQRALHLAYPDTTRWWLDEAAPVSQPAEIANRVLWRTYLWRFHPDEHQPTWWRDSESDVRTEPAPRNSMVIVVQPPWILALQDMKNFTACTSLPALPDDDVPPERRLNCSRRIWANLLDTCKRHDCHAFTLTTYHGWLFGSFSEDWKSVRISELKDFDATEPNVMQFLVYWVACSMGLAGAEHPVEETPVTE